MSQKRHQLRQFDKEELIDTILLLRARLLTLEKRIAELEGRARTAAPAKTPENSSIPSSQGWKTKRVKTTPAKRGPKVGHIGKSRQRSTPDEVIECRVAVCQRCGRDLTGVDQQPVSRRQVVDIPPMRPQVREARCYAVTCPDCSRRQVAAYPALPMRSSPSRHWLSLGWMRSRRHRVGVACCPIRARLFFPRRGFRLIPDSRS